LTKFHLSLLIHAHQPVGNFGHVLEAAYQKSYLPFVELLEKHPGVRLGLHYSGPLLEWIAEAHPEFFERLARLVASQQVEIVGGGFYEPILIAIPFEDRIMQIRRLADYLAQKIGRSPEGAWLAERIWEPQLASTLHAAGVGYTLLDDSHFLSAGFQPEQLFGYYLSEDLGRTVKLIPGLQALRYLIPFRSVDENIDFLRKAAEAHPGGLAAMGDDCEKFGVWPHTWEHCYQDGWLENYFQALESNASWLALTPPGEYLAQNPPLGRADLPTASYTEMMEWALPTAPQLRFSAVHKEFANRPDVAAFLRGGFWRSFLTKYAESGLLHKKMLHVGTRVREMQSAVSDEAIRAGQQKARTLVLRAQCNDAYWHGVFGGLYSPHLRTELWRELIRAEKIAEDAVAGRATYETCTRLDFDADGREEIYLTSETAAALIKPSDGGTIAALDFRPAAVAMVNSLERRLEASHARLKEAEAGAGGQANSIHDRVVAKEENLSALLRYDRWARHAFRLLLFTPWKTQADYQALQLEESAPVAARAYEVKNASPASVELAYQGPLTDALAGTVAVAREAQVSVRKKFSFARADGGFQLDCDLAIEHTFTLPLHLQAGLEVVLNFLAPDAADRYFEAAGERHPLNWSGTAAGAGLRVVDEWQNIAVQLAAAGAREFWVAPIETVSLSEDGFERVYQGSQILAVWPLELPAGQAWRARLSLRTTTAK